jgi:HTH-type transcriptional regulator/antitoxin HigA
MKTPKTEVREPIGCFECDAGMMHPIVEDYTIELKSLGKVAIPKVPMQRCDCCGDTLIDGDGSAYIDDYVDKATNALRPEELNHFLEKYSLTQKEAAQITGYGEKNISRWLSGRARATTSVSNFFRTLIAEPSAFERLKAKDWSEVTPTGTFIERMPDAEEKQVLQCIDYKKLVELGLVAEVTRQAEKRTEVCRRFCCENLIDFKEYTESASEGIAALKDTQQKSNLISSGTWIRLGEMAAQHIEVAHYDREKLRLVIHELREYTQHAPEAVIEHVQASLCKVGVALVFVPIMKESALRGCTRLLDPSKALIIHGLKYRNISQFWLVLFHEIAHLLLHIETPEDFFAEYEYSSDDPREAEADEWARNTLVYQNELTEFATRHPKPALRELAQFSSKIKVHPAIIAEVFNRRAGKDVLAYSYLAKNELFPLFTAEQVKKLWQVTADRIIKAANSE